MGHQVKRVAAAMLSCLLVACPVSAHAEPSQQAIGMDLFASTDADKTDVIRAGVNLDWNFKNPEQYQGIRIEKAWFRPLGQQTTSFERGYLRYADHGGGWAWQGQIGTDGHTVLGAISIHDSARIRKEFFVERDILETRQGVSRGLYYTFAGAALDLPIDDRNNITVVAGAQPFTGENVRLHGRVNFVHAVKPSWGLTVQLRTRYFRDSVPFEYDYFSPRWYAQLLPVVQLRRFSGGWRYSVAAGWGAQRDSGSPWRSSRYAYAQVTSPAAGRKTYFNAAFTYSNTPVGSGYVYSYGQLTLGLTRVF